MNFQYLQLQLIKIIRGLFGEVLFFPCPLCRHNYGNKENYFCRECLQKIDFIQAPFCPGCGGTLDGALDYCSKCLNMSKRPWSMAGSLFALSGVGQQTIHKLKYGNAPYLVTAITQLTVSRFHYSPEDFDYIMFVPLHFGKYFHRGYNQVELWANELSSQWHIPVINNIKRIKRGSHQARANRSQRLENLKNAFTLIHPETVLNKRILLLDDVFTTGSTLSVIAELLHQAQVAKLQVLTMARR